MLYLVQRKDKNNLLNGELRIKLQNDFSLQN